MTDKPDWNERYNTGDTPWDTGKQSPELLRVLTEWDIRPSRALEAGCGTGTNSILLAQRGFEVTAFDVSELAIQRAQSNAHNAGVDVTFFTANYLDLPDTGPPFSFVFDRGFYHVVRRENIEAFISLMKKVTEPGSLWLTLAGNANDPHPHKVGPPQVRAVEICSELEPSFALVQLREFPFAAKQPDDPMHPLAWSVLLRRR